MLYINIDYKDNHHMNSIRLRIAINRSSVLGVCCGFTP